MRNKMERKTYCPNCDEEISFSVKKETKSIVVLKETLTVSLLEPYCSECGSLLDVPSVERINAKTISDAYRNRVGLLSSEEIIAIRKKYGLSSSAIARLLGAGEKTITRYENGQIQDLVYEHFLRTISDTTAFICLFNLYGSRLSKREQAKVKKALSLCLDGQPSGIKIAKAV